MKTYVHFWNYLAQFFLEWEMFQTKVAEKNKTLFYVQYLFFFSENRAVYEIMWKEYGTAGQSTDDNIIRRIRIACWIIKAIQTHTEYVTLIAFPRQQWLRERASILRLCVYFLSCFTTLSSCERQSLHSGDYEEGCFLEWTPYSSADVYRRFTGTWCLHHLGRWTGRVRIY
jgi:hypothetical protein